jgi:hypothetical protein
MLGKQNPRDVPEGARTWRTLQRGVSTLMSTFSFHPLQRQSRRKQKTYLALYLSFTPSPRTIHFAPSATLNSSADLLRGHEALY